ncbi:MAG: hypothetical protein DMF04_04815 [Verrucomicrobia bacterium]|nr:MAG: hypothetical protein DMF04_04815 [Verrucomicrobiota bacterium]
MAKVRIMRSISVFFVILGCAAITEAQTPFPGLTGARIYPAETARHFIQKFQSAVDWSRGDGRSRFRYRD